MNRNDHVVSPQGADTNPGTREQPFATLRHAAAVLGPGDTCYLREGIYRETLRPERSGAPDAEITFAAFPGEEAVISAADVPADWQDDGDGTWSAPWLDGLPDGNQLFADGQMLCEACWPAPGDSHLFQPVRAEAQGGSETTLIDPAIPGPADAWLGAQLWCAGGAAWVCWCSTVTGYDAATHTLTFDPPRDRWYTPRQGNKYVLRGVRRALHAPGQWFHDSERARLILIPPEGQDPRAMAIEAKRRIDAIDLSGRAFIRIRGIRFVAGGIRTDKDSAHIVLESLVGRYVAHSYTQDVSRAAGVLVQGTDTLVLSCDLGYSSGSVLDVQGCDNRVVNCHIHHGGYGGLWRGAVGLAGRRLVFSHNTVCHSGRDLVSIHGLSDSLVQYNDLSDAGWLTADLGMLYGHDTDFANMQVRYNRVHDNHAEDCSMGIYFDHLSQNAIVHHNVIWNVGRDPVRFNNPGFNNLVFNNSAWRTGETGTFDHSHRDDLFGCRYENNIVNESIRLPAHVVVEGNLVAKDPPFVDPAAGDFQLKAGAPVGVGAFEHGTPPWRAGCDLAHPPDPLPVHESARIDWMNLLRNSAFETGTLEGWQPTHAGTATLIKGNGWGNNWGTDKGPEPTGTSKHELRLGPGRDGVEQEVIGLTPNTTYTLSAWLKVSDVAEAVILGVRDHGGDEEAHMSVSELIWTRRSLDFTTGPTHTKATIFLFKMTDLPGHAWCDNCALPLTPSRVHE